MQEHGPNGEKPHGTQTNSEGDLFATREDGWRWHIADKYGVPTVYADDAKVDRGPLQPVQVFQMPLDVLMDIAHEGDNYGR